VNVNEMNLLVQGRLYRGWVKKVVNSREMTLLVQYQTTDILCTRGCFGWIRSLLLEEGGGTSAEARGVCCFTTAGEQPGSLVSDYNRIIEET